MHMVDKPVRSRCRQFIPSNQDNGRIPRSPDRNRCIYPAQGIPLAAVGHCDLGNWNIRANLGEELIDDRVSVRNGIRAPAVVNCTQIVGA